MYEPQKSEHNEDTNNNNNNNQNQEEQSSVVEGGIGSTFQTAANTTDGSIRAPSPQQPPLINNYFQSQSQPNTANSTNNMGIKVDNSNRGINVDNIFASITDEVATTTTTSTNHGNNMHVANVNSNNIFQNFATHTNSSSILHQPTTATNSNIPFRKYSDSNANYNQKGNVIPASNCIAPIDSQYTSSKQGASSSRKDTKPATLNRLSESDGTSEEIGEILMSKSYDARSFLRPGVHRNMSERYVILSTASWTL